jgi:hypothetical protein
MDTNKISKLQTALVSELNSSILGKIEQIKEKIILGTGSNRNDYLQILTMVDDDLDDVLLNWETSAYTSKLFMSEDDMLNYSEGDDDPLFV